MARLATDTRMQHVWAHLSRRKRPAGNFYYTVQAHPYYAHLSPSEAHASALGEVLFAIFCIVRDNRKAGKLDEAEATKQRLLDEARTLRRVANDLIASICAAPHYVAAQVDLQQHAEDAEALHRVAIWRESLAADIRNADDPLTISNARGDPLARGVQIDIACFLKERFGDHLHGISGTLTAVALGLAEAPSASVSRSAFLEPNSP